MWQGCTHHERDGAEAALWGSECRDQGCNPPAWKVRIKAPERTSILRQNYHKGAAYYVRGQKGRSTSTKISEMRLKKLQRRDGWKKTLPGWTLLQKINNVLLQTNTDDTTMYKTFSLRTCMLWLGPNPVTKLTLLLISPSRLLSF